MNANKIIAYISLQCTKIFPKQLLRLYVRNVRWTSCDIIDSVYSQRSRAHKQELVGLDSLSPVYADDLPHAAMVPPRFETWNQCLEIHRSCSQVSLFRKPISRDCERGNSFSKGYGDHSIRLRWVCRSLVSRTGNSSKRSEFGRLLPFLESSGSSVWHRR